jgi:lysophospholipase L1-like esterase
MKKTLLRILPFFLFIAGSALAEQSPYVPQRPLAQLELKDGDSIVFLGDSITHQCLYTQYVEDYFYTRFPKMRLKIHNAGVGGSRAWDAHFRFDQDIASYKPKYVTVLLGMNDGRYAEYFDDVFNSYQEEMTRLLKRIDDCGATAILMTPTMFDARARRMQGGGFMGPKAVSFYNSTLAYYGTWLRDTAYQSGLGFVDMWGPLNQLTFQERQKDPSFTMIKDSVHPDAPGQVVMATAMIHDLNLPTQVSKVELALKDGKWSSSTESASLSEMKGTSHGQLSFTLLEDALPWILPEEAQLGVSLTRLAENYSRQTLSASGLPQGQYVIFIDGKEIATASHEELATGIHLQANAKTPQVQQAAQVAALNKKRNEGPVKALRNEWGHFQSVKYLQSQVQKNPNDEAEKQRLVDAEKRIIGMEERVNEAQKQALAIEDEIFKINQPKAHRFEIRPVAK